VIVLVAIVVAVAHSNAETPQEMARAYNLEGMKAYHKFEWTSAEEWFRKALEVDPDHKLANYNLACVLSRQLSRDHLSWHVGEDDPSQDPFDQLARAIKVDPSAAEKAAHDPDFITIRLTPRFQMLIGADLKSPRLIEILLVAQGEWYGPCTGAWAGHNLLFFESGEVQKKIYTHDEEGRDTFKYAIGRYSISPGVITVRFASGEVLEGHFGDDGALYLGTERYLFYPIHDI
jgi:tetratricopeptide (TPR) repeat protein